MIENGKVYQWEEITKAYPNMYAIITDVARKDEMIQSCRVLKIVPYEQEEETVCYYMDSGIDFDCVRTTFSAPNMGVYY